MTALHTKSESHHTADSAAVFFSQVVRLECPTTVEQLACALRHAGCEIALLTSGWAHHTVIAARPLLTISLGIDNGQCTLIHLAGDEFNTGYEKPATLWSGRSMRDGTRNGIGQLFQYIETYTPRHPSVLPDGIGWIGHITYDAGRGIELPSPHLTCSLAAFQLYGEYYISTHDGNWLLIGAARGRPAGPDRTDQMATFLQAAATAGSVTSNIITFVHSPEQQEFLAAVSRAQQYIAEGDIYQINISRRWDGKASDPLALWIAMYTASPGRYSAFIEYGGKAICSTSPEMFLTRRGDKLITSPIKGTQPRSPADANLDQLALQNLLESRKERAELAMIVDLLRNDLGRVCRIGTVRILAERESECLPSVWQTYATISGETDLDWGDIFCGMLPGGSITGVPKIRAMEIIDQLEPYKRGVYCGNVGWLRGDAGCFNIAIRTAVWEAGNFHYHAGAGIVSDSEAEREYAEIFAKARVITHLASHIDQ
jgi:anthranilate/para-aminobenzoate synthase component I